MQEQIAWWWTPWICATPSRTAPPAAPAAQAARPQPPVVSVPCGAGRLQHGVAWEAVDKAVIRLRLRLAFALPHQSVPAVGTRRRRAPLAACACGALSGRLAACLALMRAGGCPVVRGERKGRLKFLSVVPADAC